MNSSVYRSGDFACKPITHLGRGSAIKLTCDALTLRSFGVHTPLLAYDSAHNRLLSEWIESSRANDLLKDSMDQCRTSNSQLPALITRLMLALSGLHRVPSDCIGLKPLDVTRRIRPRLTQMNVDSAVNRHFHKLQHELKHIAHLTAHCTVHGDLHVGQFLEDEAGQIWLIDLDDMAAGQLESDLGNFSAHLASHPIFGRGTTLSSWYFWSHMVVEIYQGISGYIPNWRCVQVYGSLALLRRALKLAASRDSTVCVPQQPFKSTIIASIRVFDDAVSTQGHPVQYIAGR